MTLEAKQNLLQLNIQRTVSNETTTLVSEIPNIIDKENVIIDEKEKTPVSILSDIFCKEQSFSYLLPKGKFGFNAPRNTPISPVRYFKRLLNFNQYFASDPDLFFYQVFV